MKKQPIHSEAQTLPRSLPWEQHRKLKLGSWRGHQRPLCPSVMTQPLGLLPTDVIRLAGILQIQAVGLLPLLVGAHGHDGLPPPLCAGDVPAGAEQHSIAVLGGDLVKELPQGLVALAAIADLVGHAGGAGGDVGAPVLLAGIIEVAGLGCVQAVVPFGNVLHCKAERNGEAAASAQALPTPILFSLRS